MPFKPKLIAPDEAPVDEAGELQLPGELVELAQRLTSDADALASAYPARSPANWSASPVAPDTVNAPSKTSDPSKSRERATSPRRWLGWIASLLGLLVAVTVGVAVYFAAMSGEQTRRSVSDAPAAGQSEHVAETANPSSPQPQPSAVSKTDREQPATAPARAESAPWSTAPALFLREVSGPELEALLDLMEQEARQRVQVSI